MSTIAKTSALMGTVLALSSALGVGGATAAEKRVLRMANWVPPVHHLHKTIPMWAAEVEKASGGTLKIELMKTPLAKAPGQYDLIKNGVVDLAYGVAAFTPKRFHVFRGIEVPFMLKNAEAGSAGLWEWYARTGMADKEFHDTKLVAAFTPAPMVYHSNKPLKTLEDLRGLKVRAGGAGIPILKRLGAVPIFIPPSGSTEALERGTVDATQFPWEGLAGFRLNDLTPHHLEMPGGLYATAFWIAMSKKTWNSLTDAQKKAFEDWGLEGSRIIGKQWDKYEQKAKAAAVANGNTVTVLSGDELAKLKATTKFLEDEWVNKANAAGVDGKALIGDLNKTVKKYE